MITEVVGSTTIKLGTSVCPNIRASERMKPNGGTAVAGPRKKEIHKHSIRAGVMAGNGTIFLAGNEERIRVMNEVLAI